MNWSRVLLGSGVTLAGAAWLNGRVRDGVRPLRNPVGGEEIRYRWRGRTIAGTVRGEGPPVLLVHAIHAAAWSWEWRHTVDALAQRFRVYTFDLLGYGRSERPDVDYSAEMYVGLMSDFAHYVVGEPCALIANSLSGAHALMAADRAPERFPALVVIQPTGLTRLTSTTNPPANAIGRLVRTPVGGEAFFNALVSRPSIRFFMGASYADPSLATDEVVDDHYQTAHQPGARFAPAAFVGFRLNADVREVVHRIRQPTLVVWGEHPHSNPITQLEAFRRERPDWETVVVERAGDLPHDERPEEFNRIVLDFLEREWTPLAAQAEAPATAEVGSGAAEGPGDSLSAL